MYCKKCGYRIPDDSVFCQKCGTNQGCVVKDSSSEYEQAAPLQKAIQEEVCLKSNSNVNDEEATKGKVLLNEVNELIQRFNIFRRHDDFKTILDKTSEGLSYLSTDARSKKAEAIFEELNTILIHIIDVLERGALDYSRRSMLPPSPRMQYYSNAKKDVYLLECVGDLFAIPYLSTETVTNHMKDIEDCKYVCGYPLVGKYMLSGALRNQFDYLMYSKNSLKHYYPEIYSKMY